MIEFDWIDKMIIYLNSRIGIYKFGKEFFFEPTPQFYETIATGDIKSLNAAMRGLASHIESNSCPIIEDWKELDNPVALSDHFRKSEKEPPGLIRYNGPNRSRIQINVANKFSPVIMGGILAHELTHHYLFNKGITLDDEVENERLTDLATVFLGLGKLTMNGYQPIDWMITGNDGLTYRYTYQVGYLSPKELAMITGRVCKLRSIPLEIARKNLSSINYKYLSKLKDFKDLDKTLQSRRKKGILGFIKKDINYVIVPCGKCGRRLKLPKMKKELLVTCPICKYKFTHKNKWLGV